VHLGFGKNLWNTPKQQTHELDQNGFHDASALTTFTPYTSLDAPLAKDGIGN
jgi:hypothetical protein